MAARDKRGSKFRSAVNQSTVERILHRRAKKKRRAALRTLFRMQICDFHFRSHSILPAAGVSGCAHTDAMPSSFAVRWPCSQCFLAAEPNRYYLRARIKFYRITL
jgi:hypothetical protein